MLLCISLPVLTLAVVCLVRKMDLQWWQLSECLKLPFDPQPYLEGINEEGINKRAILIHLALSESPARDLLRQMVRALIKAD